MAARLSGPYDHVCVIPAMDECADLLDGLAAAAAGSRWLAIVVVNGQDDAGEAVHRSNAALLRDLRARCRGAQALVAQAPPMWLGRLADTPTATQDMNGSVMDLLLVDRASPGWRLDARDGVGLARRIGCDIALSLYAAGKLRSRWIHTTDADVTLPADYFAAAVDAPADCVALVYPFWHQAVADEVLSVATGLYEISLRYYMLGLAWAGSPYAFHTVGSTFAVDARAYAAVRGVPKRRAGEDFYLINKLAKLGPVKRLDSALLHIRARPSTRVPFGTGPATRTIARNLVEGRPYCLYHPAAFVLLRLWLTTLRQAILAPEAPAADMLAAWCTADSDHTSTSTGDLVPHAASSAAGDIAARAASGAAAHAAAHAAGDAAGDVPPTAARESAWPRAWDAAWDQARVQIPKPLAAVRGVAGQTAWHAAMTALGSGRAMADARSRTRSNAALFRRMHCWFDAFRTLKFVHAVRDAGFASVPWQQALAWAPFVPDLPVAHRAGNAAAARVASDYLAPPSDAAVTALRRTLLHRECGLAGTAGIARESSR